MSFFSKAYAASSHLPMQGTEIAAKWDHLYLFLIWLSVFFFILVVGGMMYFVIKYRQQPGRRAKYITGNVPIEIVWTAVPLVLLLVIFGWGYVVYNDMTRAPSGSYEIRVIAKQWLWQFQYDDGRTTVGELYVPANKPVKLLMTSTDVLHSFFVPAFRVKQDVVPGMFTSVWFEATVPGKHQIYCTEYCGTSHSEMLAKVIVLEDQQWEDWRAGKKIAFNDEPAGAAKDQIRTTASSTLSVEAAAGLKVVESKGCVACHSGDGSKKTGPTFKGVFGKKVAFVDGTTGVVDAAYIRESIEKPGAKIVKGYDPMMPPYEGMLTDEDYKNVTAYIQALK